METQKKMQRLKSTTEVRTFRQFIDWIMETFSSSFLPAKLDLRARLLEDSGTPGGLPDPAGNSSRTPPAEVGFGTGLHTLPLWRYS